LVFVGRNCFFFSNYFSYNFFFFFFQSSRGKREWKTSLWIC
jgi:hypothetical protein